MSDDDHRQGRTTCKNCGRDITEHEGHPPRCPPETRDEKPNSHREDEQ